MAIILVFVGSLIGFASAVASIFLLHFGILAALALWSGIGMSISVLGLIIATLPRSTGHQPHLAKAA